MRYIRSNLVTFLRNSIPQTNTGFKSLHLRTACQPIPCFTGYRHYSKLQEKLKELGLKPVEVPEVKERPKLSIEELRKILSDIKPVEDTLVDKFQRTHTYLRISLTERCNLRCLYCMPEDGVDLTPSEQLLTTEEIIKLVRLFSEEGVDKIRFTGGEPTVRKDLENIIEEIGKIEKINKIAITTNGIVLGRKLENLQKKGLNQLNISLDTLDKSKFEYVTRRKGFEKVLESIETALRLGYQPVKINCVIMRNFNDMEIIDFIEHFTKDKNVDVRFIEYMPFDGNSWSDTKLVSYHDILSIIKSRYPSFNRLPDSSPNETAKTWKVDGYVGTVSFITSMTEHFCNSCNRIRLTADGNLKVCLFGAAEVSLRDAIRAGFSDDELKKLISYAIKKKKAHHAGMYNIASSKNRPMILIGG